VADRPHRPHRNVVIADAASGRDLGAEDRPRLQTKTSDGERVALAPRNTALIHFLRNEDHKRRVYRDYADGGDGRSMVRSLNRSSI
jgi:hypothetical protein